MTIQGAIVELQNLLNADDVPFYYKGGIEKVIETIQMELADRKTEPPTDDRCIGCKFTDGEICYCPEDCEVCDRDGYKTENCSEFPNNCEPQTERCPFDDPIPCEWVCTEWNHCKYKPKTEPQTERSE